MPSTEKPHPPKRPANRRGKGRGPQTGLRLNKFLAQSAAVSRRDADDLMRQGRVEVDGKLVVDLGTRVDPERQKITLDGERLKVREDRLAILLNKPVGYLCSENDPEGRPLITSLVPKGVGLHTIGRLDFNTEGVILLTTDGDLAERLGHARYSVQRVYEARVRGVPTEETLAKLRRGVRLEDGPARAESAEIVAQTDKNAWLRLVLVEGRNREVRRLMERVGHPVMRLRRVAFAGLTALGLKLGQWRELSEAEVAQLQARGHVGNFELPPDPRRKGQTGLVRRKKHTDVPERSQTREEGQAEPGKRTRKPPAEKADKAGKSSRTAKGEGKTGKPSHDWQPPREAKKGKQAPPRVQRPRAEPTERFTDGRRRKVTRDTTSEPSSRPSRPPTSKPRSGR